ncbi:hypothetical protein POX_a00437 [Penicillium oxalicum]|uniref:tRNA-splicing endonuclease subunit Sen2 n=1 Tax=Penicillium oxalicum (strain 114-2 / CGMCC 5302) TaxID=933388 RepID=S7ZV13_PENO1|nr:hypothetical protein POX_a00437 [Penicillium oxalicum]EPS34590.1 hypothetical protein PDE_09554 [Penicillium oxalicum 114-2]KAI2793850.1 hypothetical protein POX_a00437 [Penicillium oxalicum]
MAEPVAPPLSGVKAAASTIESTAAKPDVSEKVHPPRASRPPRPNYRHIHRFPLPVNVHHVPSVIPHNPLSIISVALSYLTFLVSPPRQEILSAYFDSATSSVHVSDEKTIRALWEMGFFGKGSLSRSEPTWLEQEKKRRGLMGGSTVEEATRKRRAERRQLKLERARHEKLAVEERLRAEAAARENGASHGLLVDEAADAPAISVEKFSVKRAMEAKFLERRQQAMQNRETAQLVDSTNSLSSPFENQGPLPISTTPIQNLDDELDLDIFDNEEHLQLSNEEAFFLVYALGALRIVDRTTNVAIPTPSLLNTLRRHSYYPPRPEGGPLKVDDPFMISYAVYHHFRSLGWVVRSGVKFGTDYLLYNRGPVFSHAEFAVIIIPSYSHEFWSSTEDLKKHATEKQSRSWWWLHCVNRVQAQVKKSLVICYVDVPPPAGRPADVGADLNRYRIREFLLRRWVPNRTRD